MESENRSLSDSNRYYLELGSVPEAMTLLDIWYAITKHKLIIVMIVGFFLTLTTFLSVVVPTKYKAEVVVAEANPVLKTETGSSGSSVDIGVEVVTNEALAMISSRKFVAGFIKENKLMPILFSVDWDKDKNDWIDSEDGDHPTLWDGYKKFNDDVLDVETEAETNLTTISIEWTDAEASSKWANLIVAKVNAVLRQRAIDEAQRTLDYLNTELLATTSLELKESLYDLVKAQKSKIVAANVYEQYAFKIIDPSVVPEEPAIPYLTLILLAIGLILGTFFGVTTVLLLNLIQIARANQ